MKFRKYSLFSIILYKLGKSLLMRGSYPKAIQILEKCRILLQGNGNSTLLALTFFDLAGLYHKIHRLEKSRLFYKDALRLFRRLGHLDSVADAAIALGNVELQLGQLQQAKRRLEEVREYYANNQNRLKEINKLLKVAERLTQ
ncbi:MAG: tetratricopeptide repeat protein [Oscillatoria sp. SIO1A7]|nr:tetratricopeptide repeat protein [Oscillatoria sp. SIO1A7]